MALIGTSLNAVTAYGPGSVITFDDPKAYVSMYITATTSTTGSNVNLEGTLDGINFFTMLSLATNAGSAGSKFGIATGPVIGVRANFTGAGGQFPTVTAIVAGA